MRRFLMSISFFVSVFLVKADENTDLFDAANEQYLQENYTQAIEQYSTLENQGYSSFNLHFNNGNTYFELEDWTSAIIQYERALKHKPNNENVQHNLSLAIDHTQDQLSFPASNKLAANWDGLAAMTNSSSWAKMCLLYLILAMLLFIIYSFSKKRLFSIVSVVLLVGTFLAFFLARTQYAVENDSSFIVLVTPEINIQSAPSNESENLFLLHEGTKAKIIDEVDDWVQITLPNQEKGWTKKDEWVVI